MHIHSTLHVMIAGSRYATRDMLAYAHRAVERAHRLGWTVLVGDHPYGVDRAVVEACQRFRTPVIVAGLGNFPRNGGCRHGAYVRITRDLYRAASGQLLGGYTARDRWLVDQAQICLFIWNGESPGTKAGYDYAVQRGKTAYLVPFAPKGVGRG